MATSIPLHCNICPKLPKFSDLSHLLTHVASKGHLSHYFKAQVRSSSEPSIRKELEAYDDWYDRHRIGKLMCQRMNSKETKPTKPDRRRRTKAKPVEEDVKLATIPATRGRKKTKAKIKREVVIDPQLTSIPVPSTDGEDDADELEFQGQITRPGVPYMSSRVTNGTATDTPVLPQAGASICSLPYPFLNDIGEAGNGESVPIDEKKSIYPDPSSVQPHSFENGDFVPDLDIGSTGSSLTSVPSDTPDIEDLQGVAECSKLKGTIWPGMDLFDSANALAKRRRNQKKDGSILAQMKWTSATVQPTETIYTIDGNLYKIRPITGQVESSPFKLPTPKPRKARGKPKRIALGPVDSNTARPKKAPPNGGPPRRRGRPRNAELPETPSKPSKSLTRRMPAEKRCLTPLDDEQVEWQLNMGEEPTGKRKKMRIYPDADQLDPSAEKASIANSSHFDSNEVFAYFEESSSFADSPFPATHGLPFLNSTFTPQPSYLNNTFESYPLGHSAPNPLHPDNKENVEPVLNPLGRIDDAAMNFQAHRSAQRYFVTQHNQPTHFFNTYPSNMPFGSYYSGGFPMGSYVPQVQYSSATQYPYAPTMPTMPMMNPLRSTYTTFQHPAEPAQHTPPPQEQPQTPRHLCTPSPRGTIVVKTASSYPRKRGVNKKPHHLMTKPGGPGSEDGDTGDDTIDEGILENDFSGETFSDLRDCLPAIASEENDHVIISDQ